MRAHLPRNYVAHVLHGLGGQTGFRLLMAPTFVPSYLFLLSGSELVVGAARALQSLGQAISPLLGATLIEHRRRVLPVGFLTGGAMRLQVLLIALAGFLLPDRPALVAICVCLGLFGFFQGIQGVIFNFLMSKTIPVERRGLLTGMRNALAGVTVAAVSYGGGRLVESEALGNGYATTFLVAFGLTAFGLLALTLVREPEPPEVRARSNLLGRLADLPALIRADPSFGWYLVARALATTGRMSMPFYVLYAATRLDIGGYELGLLTVLFSLCQSSVNFLWGLIADRHGCRAVFLCALVVWIASVLALIGASGFWVVALCFAGVGAGLGGFMLASLNMVLEFGDRTDLPLQIAAANASSELMGALGLLLGGVLATQLSLASVLVTGVVLKAAAMAVLVGGVREPRSLSA